VIQTNYLWNKTFTLTCAIVIFLQPTVISRYYPIRRNRIDLHMVCIWKPGLEFNLLMVYNVLFYVPSKKCYLLLRFWKWNEFWWGKEIHMWLFDNLCTVLFHLSLVLVFCFYLVLLCLQDSREIFMRFLHVFESHEDPTIVLQSSSCHQIIPSKIKPSPIAL
jgi:hypothetical protein